MSVLNVDAERCALLNCICVLFRNYNIVVLVLVVVVFFIGENTFTPFIRVYLRACEPSYVAPSTAILCIYVRRIEARASAGFLDRG